MKAKQVKTIKRRNRVANEKLMQKHFTANRIQSRAEENRKNSKARLDLKKKIGLKDNVSYKRVVLNKSITDCNAAKQLIRGEHYTIKNQK